ncbi:helix-turn-helix transcriptional regulator [Sinorhizobium sp. 7-81]|uniref:helix-turn-helix domain-containing protein n=1 Tax=Sinorhizobium sp. 8-89 TaxID=3049089 RepID=UPI0024C42431|nr:helix-turn-helix transcriptional regulator [Sinorhizobium sp. 8-89]MDK1490509.1 helix-turn-helix transcriptional regulator [Sinorhizobium sp. 8-89]
MKRFFFKEWRENAGFASQKALAEVIGFTPAMVSRVEAGKRDGSVDYLVAFAKACGCRPGDPLNRPPSSLNLTEALSRVPPQIAKTFHNAVDGLVKAALEPEAREVPPLSRRIEPDIAVINKKKGICFEFFFKQYQSAFKHREEKFISPFG